MFNEAVLALSAFVGGIATQAQPAGAQTSVASPAPKVDESTQTEDVNFKSDGNNRMTVPVRLSGTGPYDFLVDTGANRTVISRELAGRLKLPPGDQEQLHSVTGVSTVSTVVLPDLELTRKAVKNIDAPLLESANMGADGILGADSLSTQRVLFDFQGHKLSIVPSSAPDFRDEPGTIVIKGKRRNGRLILTDALIDGHRLTVVIDTGSEISIGNAALRRKLLGDRTVGSQQIELLSVTGETITGDYTFVPSLEIGGLSFRNLGLVFADAHTFKQLKLDDQPALLLGMNAIRAFKKVSIDFPRRKFRVVLPEESSIQTRFAQARFD